MNSAPSPARSLAVGVYDEPELVVQGIGGMLSTQGLNTRVLPLSAGSTTTRIDVLLCDPVGRPVELEEYLAAVATLTDAPVVVFTWSNSPSTARRAIAAGARGVVSKAVGAAEFAAAVEAVQRGQTLAATTQRPSANNGKAELSTREAEVLELICRGLSNLEIAEQLYVSVNSVKTYVRQIYQKIGVARRAQAVAWGLAHGY